MAPDTEERDPDRQRLDGRILTVPNLISLIRLLLIPVFCWQLFDGDRWLAMAILGGLGATDWIDGWIARRFDQGSELGKILDPTADRLLLLAAGVSLVADGVVPVWVAVLILGREAVVGAGTLAIAAAGAARIDVQWVGKAGTFALMFALPGFLLVDLIESDALRDVFEALTWFCTISGLVLGYYAAARYVPLARAALREGRAARAAAEVTP